MVFVQLKTTKNLKHLEQIVSPLRLMYKMYQNVSKCTKMYLRVVKYEPY